MRSTLSAFNEVWQCQFRKRILGHLSQFDQNAKIVLGCSGGMDSMLLLHLLFELIPQRLHVVSIDHQLQEQSKAWSVFVTQICQYHQIPCSILSVQVSDDGNLENNARLARYQAFISQLNPSDILVLAHHQQDQAETVILRLLQGSGVQGLAAMNEIEERQLIDNKNYILWRPLLSLSKQKIESWINALNIKYISDPMNDDQHYDRVWARETLWSVLEDRFPKMQEGIFRSSRLMQDAHEILIDVLYEDLKQCLNDEQYIVLDKFKVLSSARQRQLLSSWMQANNLYRPPLALVEKLLDEVIYAREDAQSILHHAGYYFMRFDELIYRYSESEWQSIQILPKTEHIRFSLLESFELRVGQIRTKKMSYGLDSALLNEELVLLPRQGGEKIELYGRKGHKVLKKELQAAKIAPWLRHQTQILMYHNVILGVFTPKGFWLAASTFVQDGGWQPVFING